MHKAALLMLTSAIVFLAACGPSYVPPANNSSNKPADKPKKSYKAEYDRESRAAFAAQDAYMKVRGKGGNEEKEKFYIWTEHLYAALKFASLHEKENGEKSIEGWSKLSGPGSIKEMRASVWKNEGQSFKEDKRVKDAIADWEKAMK